MGGQGSRSVVGPGDGAPLLTGVHGPAMAGRLLILPHDGVQSGYPVTSASLSQSGPGAVGPGGAPHAMNDSGPGLLGLRADAMGYTLRLWIQLWSTAEWRRRGSPLTTAARLRLDPARG
jgi:hypothetical protein